MHFRRIRKKARDQGLRILKEGGVLGVRRSDDCRKILVHRFLRTVAGASFEKAISEHLFM
ncbi:hypothetical protein DESC_270004 [Desulfosarcina cetonica]|nr:hypothetical protein DESC_270004 [Desulfosarcina cetonica]